MIKLYYMYHENVPDDLSLLEVPDATWDAAAV